MKKIKSRAQKICSPVVLTISEVSRGGAGVARDVEGRAVFVPYTAPGDVVKVGLRNIKPKYADAELLEIIAASSVRQLPRCPVFTQCGGCQWQHLPYDLQWSIKRNGLIESLRRAGINSVPQWDEFPAKAVWEYRNRIQLRRKGKDIGFYSNHSHELVPIEQCPISHPAINREISLIHDEINVEISQGVDLGNKNEKVEVFLSAQGKVERALNAQHAGQGFRQVNDEQNKNLQSWIAQFVIGVDGILDLYGGSGNLSLGFAPTVSKIHCVDLHIPRSLAVSPDNVDFHQISVKTWLENRVEKLKYARKTSVNTLAWLALIDPPRNGLNKEGDNIIQSLQSLKLSTIILVGCKSDPWSRDVAKFVAQGWRLDRAVMFDFFPQTHHVEAAALLRR